MSKDNKQKILTAIIIVALVALILIIAYVVYSEKISENKKDTSNTAITENLVMNNNTIAEPEEEAKVEEKEPESNNNYIGQEENESTQQEDTQLTKDEKAIQLAKDKWGEDDSVTYNIEEKKGNTYYIAVKSNATVVAWYEVNIETWTINEFY